MPSQCPVEYIPSTEVLQYRQGVLLVSEFSASTQQLFLPDKHPVSNHSTAFREGMEDKKGVDHNGLESGLDDRTGGLRTSVNQITTNFATQ